MSEKLTSSQVGLLEASPPIEEEKKRFNTSFVDRSTALSREEWDAFKAWTSGTTDGSPGKEIFDRDSANENGPGPLSRVSSMRFDEKALKISRRPGVSILGLPTLSPAAPWYWVWSQIILVLDMTYVAFLIPIIIGFQLDDIHFTWSCIVDLVFGAIYVIELLLNFHVGIIAKYRSEQRLVMDGLHIARYYVFKGTFIIDFLTGIAWITQVVMIFMAMGGQEPSNNFIAVYQGIRLLRLFRLSSLLNRLLLTFSTASSSLFESLRLSQTQRYCVSLMYTGGVLINLLSSVWNFVAIAQGFNPSWVNYYAVLVRTYGSPESQDAGRLTPEEAAAVPATFRYLLGTYYSIVTLSTIGYGDLTPQTSVEYGVAIAFIVVSVIFFTMLIGSIGEALSRFSRSSQRASAFRQRMECVDLWMIKRHLPRRLRDNIIQYYAEEWLKDAESVEEVGVVEELPHTLRRQVALTVNAPLFERLGFFAGPGFAVMRPIITSMMSPMRMQAGVEICSQGSPADALWLLHEGEVARVDNSKTECEMVHAPDIIGTSALLQDREPCYADRPYSYRCMTSCLLWELPLRDVMPLLRQHPDLLRELEDAAIAAHGSNMKKAGSMRAGMKDFYGTERHKEAGIVIHDSLQSQPSRQLLLKVEP